MTSALLLALGLLLAETEFRAVSVEDCDGYHYGLGGPRELRRAFACYDQQQNWIMVTVCHLNGEGTSRSVPRARAAFDRLTSEDVRSFPFAYANLQRLLEERERKPTAAPKHIDFCTDLVDGALNGTGCGRILEARKRKGERTRLAGVRAALDRPAASRLDAVDAAFEAFLEADKARAYQLFIEGSMRGDAQESQGDFVAANYARRLSALRDLVNGSSSLVAPRRYAEADAELNDVYRNMLRSEVGAAEQRAREAETEERRQEHLKYAADVRTVSRDAQRRWIRYRDAWAELISYLFGSGRITGPSSETMQALITEDRIEELRYKPLGGG